VNIDLTAAILDVRTALFQGQFEFAESILKKLFDPPGTEKELTAEKLESAFRARKERFHPWHVRTAVEPFMAYLRSHPQAVPETCRAGSREQILAQAVIQAGCGDTDGLTPLRRVVENLFEGFLSDDFREKVAGPSPTDALMPPLVEWTLTADMRPFTLDVRGLRAMGIHCGVIGMPRSFSRAGLLGWASLAHEACGHGILNAYQGLLDPVRATAKAALVRRFGGASGLPGYWDGRFGEAAADCLGILRMGPAMAVGFIGAFRAGRTFLARGNGRVSSGGGLESQDYDRSHPSDLHRALLMASLTGRLAFRKRAMWKKLLLREIGKDIHSTGPSGENGASWGDVMESADIFAAALLEAPLARLSGQSLGRWRNWTDRDEKAVADFQGVLRRPGAEVGKRGSGCEATHAVAAAILLAATEGNPVPVPAIFKRLMSTLERRMKPSEPITKPNKRKPGRTTKSKKQTINPRSRHNV
jgi:hypothetical protein